MGLLPLALAMDQLFMEVTTSSSTISSWLILSPNGYLSSGYLIITFFNFLFTEMERSKVRNAFSQYLSPVMVEKLAQSSESLVLGGERKEMTVLFSDIRGFTAISENYKDNPEGLTDLINQLLSTLSNEILKLREPSINIWEIASWPFGMLPLIKKIIGKGQ